MVKHTQTNRRQFADDLFECVWPFYEFGALRVKNRLENVSLKPAIKTSVHDHGPCISRLMKTLDKYIVGVYIF